MGLSLVEAEFSYRDNCSFFSAVDWKKTSVVPQVDFSYHKALNDKWLLGFGVGADLGDTKAGNFSEVDIEARLKRHYSIYLQLTYVINGSLAA